MNRPMPRSSRLTDAISASACSLRSSRCRDQRRGSRRDQRVHFVAKFANALHLAHGVAIVLRRGGEIATDGGIFPDQPGELFEPLFFGGIVGDIERDVDVPRRRSLIAVESVQRAIDLARRDGKANLARLDLHAAQIVGGAQRLDGGELFAVGVSPLPRGVLIADLLVDQHPGNQEHAGAGADERACCEWTDRNWPSTRAL